MVDSEIAEKLLFFVQLSKVTKTYYDSNRSLFKGINLLLINLLA